MDRQRRLPVRIPASWLESLRGLPRSASVVAGPVMAERALVHVLVPWCFPFLGARAVSELGWAADGDVAAPGCLVLQSGFVIWRPNFRHALTQADAMKERSLPLPGGCWKLQSIRLHQEREAPNGDSV